MVSTDFNENSNKNPKLEVKEGILLDADGNPLTPSPYDSGSGSEERTYRTSGNVKIRQFRLSQGLGLLLAVLFPILLVGGFAVLGSFITVLLLAFCGIWLLRKILGFFFLGSSGGRNKSWMTSYHK